MRLVVLGGSAPSTPELFEAIEAWPGGLDRRPALEVVLVGRDPKKLQLVAAASRTRLSGSGRRVEVVAEPHEERALDGADVVLEQVRIGGLEARAFDESFPRAFGLPGEETMGPGGFANALRTVPALRATWGRIALRAPRALVIDLTNPAGIVAHAARAEHDLQLVSVCDAPVTFLETIGPRLGLDREALTGHYVGMNHVGWFVPERPEDLRAIADVSPGVDAAVGPLYGAQPTAYVRFYLHPDRMLQAQRGTPTRAEQLQAPEPHRPVGLGARAFDHSPRRAWRDDCRRRGRT